MRSKASHKRSYAGFVGAQGGAPTPPVNTVAPAITGTPTVGETLTTSNGTWTGKEPPANFAYQWKAGGVNIAGATAKTYTLTEAEVGKAITVTVTARNWKGPTSATSAATAAVEAAEEA
jgi:hypothetical protein